LFSFSQTKLTVTEEVINIVEEAIVESIPLWYYLPLEGENFTIDETRILLVSTSYSYYVFASSL
jgi:hypothetical protein